MRDRLTAARTYYVRTDGNDANTGLVDSAGGAFLTVQKAIDVISGTLDLSIYDVTISVADGTYSGQIVLKSLTTGGGMVFITGNTTTPANVLFSRAGDVITATGPVTGVYKIEGFKGTCSAGNMIALGYPCYLRLGVFTMGACNNRGIEVSTGAAVYLDADWTIDGNTPNWILRATIFGFIFIATRQITFSGTRSFTSGFAEAVEGGLIHAYSVTKVGSFTGKNYNIATGGGMTLGGGGTTYFGGSVAGTINTTAGSAGWKT
ncbi:hypothetical protein [Mesorhizobium marinum]|uniref:hypothetical protein n=1 Tax=Mesorhizobium marinum TaxID=3228790 RepID=UPI003466A2C5